MKKHIASPLCSAFIAPGLGQILNQSIKKGVTLLSVAFVLIVLVTIKLALIASSIFEGLDISHLNYIIIRERLQSEDFSVLCVFLALFAILWIYSICEAFVTGKEIDAQGEDDPVTFT